MNGKVFNDCCDFVVSRIAIDGREHQLQLHRCEKRRNEVDAVWKLHCKHVPFTKMRELRGEFLRSREQHRARGDGAALAIDERSGVGLIRRKRLKALEHE